jgi:hypothetical protein
MTVRAGYAYRKGYIKMSVDHDVLGIVDRIKIFDKALYVLYNVTTGHYEIHDSMAPGGKKQTYIMRVQNPDGSPRPLDNRTVVHLMSIRRERMQDIMHELEQGEVQREKDWDKRQEALSAALADDIKWVGQAVVPSVTSRERGSKEKK